jgi:5'-3' exonuclease
MEYVIGEAEHKFARWHRAAIQDQLIPHGFRYAVYSGGSDVINRALLFHQSEMTIMRGKSEGQTELVRILRLTTAMTDCYGNSERAIDGVVALSLFIGNDFIPGIASFSQLKRVYNGVSDVFLVANRQFNREFLEKML